MCFQQDIMQRGGYFMRSRFMRSLKEESMEPMDGAFLPPILLPFPLAEIKTERMETDGNE
jgi:hypothetical protein